MKKIIICTLTLCGCAPLAALSLWGVAKIHETNRPLAIIINFAIAGAFTAIAVHNSRETARATP